MWKLYPPLRFYTEFKRKYIEIYGKRAYGDLDRPKVVPKSALKLNIFRNSRENFRRILVESGSSYERSGKSIADSNNAPRNSNHLRKKHNNIINNTYTII